MKLPRREGESVNDYLRRLNKVLLLQKTLFSILTAMMAAVIVLGVVFWSLRYSRLGSHCDKGVRCDGFGKCWCER